MKIKKDNKKRLKKSSHIVKMGFINNLKNNFYKRKILIEMQMQDGDRDFFIAQIEKNNTFTHLGKRYIVYEKYLQYYKPFRMYGLYYHENISVPIKNNINVEKLVKNVKNKESLEDYSSNIHPEVLKAFSDSKVIIDSIQGHAITNFVSFLKMMMVINLILSGIAVLILIGMSGVF